MTTASKITLIRIFLIPIMVIVIYIPALEAVGPVFNMSWAQFIFAVLFLLGSFSDFLDGYIARKYNQITNFGKFLDPLADKVLVFTALFYLMLLMPNRVMLFTVVIIMFREFMVSALRLVTANQNVVVAASIWGKLKTITTMLALILLLFNDFGLPSLIGNIIYYVAVLLTIISGVDYFIKMKPYISNEKVEN